MNDEVLLPTRTHLHDREGTSLPALSLGSWAFSFGPFESQPWSFDAFCDYAASAGYDGVEINGFRPHPHDDDLDRRGASELGESIRSRGLGISGYAPDLRSTPPGTTPVGAYLDRISSIASFCTAAGIDLVRVDSILPPPGPEPRGSAYADLITAWTRSADLLAAEGIRLVWEYEPGFWLNRPSEIVKVIEDVASENFGVMFDSSHSHTLARHGRRQGSDPEILDGGATELASMVAGHIGALHLIDSDGSLHDNDTSNHLPFGTGELDFIELLSPVRQEVLALPWWTVDYCFWPETVRDAKEAVPIVRDIRDRLAEAGGPS